MSVIKTYGKLFEKKYIRPLAKFLLSSLSNSKSLGKSKFKKQDTATDAVHELAVAIVREKVRQGKISLQEMDVSINSCLNKICKQNQADILKDVLSQSVKDS